MKVLKPEFTDRFKCIADLCTYTCCSGWRISVDEAYGKYHALYENIVPDCSLKNADGSRQMRMKDNGACPFLTENGLCRLVLSHGEYVLSKTCQEFPRSFTEEYDGLTEYGMSNGCPAVLALLKQAKRPFSFVIDELQREAYASAPPSDNVLENVQYRNQMIDLLQIEDMPLWVRLYWVYAFAAQLHENPERKAVIAKQYNQADWLLNNYEALSTVNVNIKTNLFLMNKLFNGFAWLDEQEFISVDYGYQKYIVPLRSFLGETDIGTLSEGWKEFEQVWEAQSEFLENVCVNYVFLRGISGELYKNMQVLMIEMIQIKFTAFLQWLSSGKELSDAQLIDIICYYARLYEHNLKTNVYGWLDSNADDDTLKKGAILAMLR